MAPLTARAAQQAAATANDRAETAALPLRVRWLGRVRYSDALALQKALFAGNGNHLLLLEHHHVVTMSRRTPAAHLLVDIEAHGADLVTVDRGGDVTYHGPGQLVGYPILDVPGKRGGGMADTAAYVHGMEQVLIDVLAELGLAAGRLRAHTGVWLGTDGAEQDTHQTKARKIAAIGVRISRGRSMHGFALNVDCDLSWFDRIVACGIADKGVTSLRAEGSRASMRDVVDLLVERAHRQWAPERKVDRADVAWRLRPADLSPFTRDAAAAPDRSDGTSPRLLGRLAEAGTTGDPVRLRSRKPEWLRAGIDHGAAYRQVRSTLRDLGLTTVCEEAGCPNISECWNDGTATFMILGERCTRACGFCLVDTRKPSPADPGEPARVAEAVARMGLSHAVITMPARDDLADGGAAAVAATIVAVRSRNPETAVEMLTSDLAGDEAALDVVFAARPDVFSHNIETVARLQRAVRPSAGYARSLAVLARAKAAGLPAKSSIVVGMGETVSEVDQALADLAAVGADIVTIGQYLRPSARHLPVVRWWAPEEFERCKAVGAALGIAHVEASPLTRSSYHARSAAAVVDC